MPDLRSAPEFLSMNTPSDINSLHSMILDLGDRVLSSLDELQSRVGQLHAAVAAASGPASSDIIAPSSDPSVASLNRLGDAEIALIHEIIRTHLPADAIAMVVTNGDGRLLNLADRTTWHFPQTEDGSFPGYNPPDNAAAIAELEAQRDKGGQFLFFPRTTLWWLRHYEEFASHLENHYHALLRLDDVCAIFQLCRPEPERPQIEQDEDFVYREQVRRIGEMAHAVIPPCAITLVVSDGNDELLELDGSAGWHFPRTEGGHYDGHPTNSVAAIAHLEQLRDKSAGYLVLPITSFWWRETYREFVQYLNSRYRLIARQENLCLIYELRSKHL